MKTPPPGDWWRDIVSRCQKLTEIEDAYHVDKRDRTRAASLVKQSKTDPAIAAIWSKKR